LPSGGEVGEPVTFSAGATDVWSGVANVTWSFGDGTSATGDAVTHAFTTPGTFPVSVTAADGAGNVSTRSTTVAIVDTTRPTFNRRPSVIPRRLRRGGTATVLFGVPEPVTVQVRILARRRGVWSGRRCVAASRHRSRRARRCRRTVVVVTRSTRLDIEGLGNLSIQTRRLRPGRYAVVVDAIDGAGNHSDAVTLTLTVLPRAQQPPRARNRAR
jgi:hypothetical protein